jgi:para-nitrobenzyl esterase
MCDYFCNFIRSGDPNGKDLGGETLPEWKAWSAEKPCTMYFLKEGAVPSSEPLSPFMQFLSDRIMERIG